MKKILIVLSALSLSWAADTSSTQLSTSPKKHEDHDALFLSATEIIARQQFLFRADTDGIFGSPDQFKFFFSKAIERSAKFSKSTPPPVEDFYILADSIKKFNHLWTFLIKDIVSHATTFIKKIKESKQISSKERASIAAMKNIEDTYSYCSTWLYKITKLYRSEIELIKLLSSGLNAQKIIKEIDFQQAYYTDEATAQILRDLSSIVDSSQHQKSSRSKIVTAEDFITLVAWLESQELQNFLIETTDNSNAFLVYSVNAESEFSTINDYRIFFEKLLKSFKSKNVTLDNSGEIIRNIDVLGQILDYLFTKTTANSVKRIETAQEKGSLIFTSIKNQVEKVYIYLSNWLPRLIDFYNYEIYRLGQLHSFESSYNIQKILRNQKSYTNNSITKILEDLKATLQPTIPFEEDSQSTAQSSYPKSDPIKRKRSASYAEHTFTKSGSSHK